MPKKFEMPFFIIITQHHNGGHIRISKSKLSGLRKHGFHKLSKYADQ